MAVVIIKNGKIEKTFKKYFPGFTGIEEWLSSHFITAKEKYVDRGSNTIYIRL